MKRKTFDDDFALKVAKVYANSELSEKNVCNQFKISKYIFRKLLDRVIILGIADDDIACLIANKAISNHNRKLSEMGLYPSDKVKLFYNSLLKKRTEYQKLMSKIDTYETYFLLINSLEKEIDAAKFQEKSATYYLSSEDEKDFQGYDLNKLTNELETMKKNYDTVCKDYALVKEQLGNLIKGL